MLVRWVHKSIHGSEIRDLDNDATSRLKNSESFFQSLRDIFYVLKRLIKKNKTKRPRLHWPRHFIRVVHNINARDISYIHPGRPGQFPRPTANIKSDRPCKNILPNKPPRRKNFSHPKIHYLFIISKIFPALFVHVYSSTFFLALSTFNSKSGGFVIICFILLAKSWALSGW